MFDSIRRALSHVPMLNHIVPPPPPPPPAAATTGKAGPTLGQDAVKLAPSTRPASVKLTDGEWKADLGLMHLAERTRSKDLEWFAGRPLSSGKNAHKTNTKEQMEEALKSDYSFLEGDLRATINPPHEPEMRHDPGQEAGDNLTLREWLEIGKRSGRGLKIDVKENDQVPKVLEEVEKSGVDPAKMMFNLGAAGMDRYASEIRKRFPQAILAFNPPNTPEGLQHAIDQAKSLGKPYTFVMNDHDLNPDNIKQLEAAGPVSVWNSPSGSSEEIAARRDWLRDHGVTGIVDLRPGLGIGGTLEMVKDKAEGYLEDGLDKVKHVGSEALHAGKSLVSKLNPFD